MTSPTKKSKSYARDGKSYARDSKSYANDGIAMKWMAKIADSESDSDYDSE